MVVDVLNDPGGREQLLRLGVRKVPVVAKGDRFVFGQLLEQVARFVGLAGTFSRERFMLRFPGTPVIQRFHELAELF